MKRNSFKRYQKNEKTNFQNIIFAHNKKRGEVISNIWILLIIIHSNNCQNMSGYMCCKTNSGKLFVHPETF